MVREIPSIRLGTQDLNVVKAYHQYLVRCYGAPSGFDDDYPQLLLSSNLAEYERLYLEYCAYHGHKVCYKYSAEHFRRQEFSKKVVPRRRTIEYCDWMPSAYSDATMRHSAQVDVFMGDSA